MIDTELTFPTHVSSIVVADFVATITLQAYNDHHTHAVSQTLVHAYVTNKLD